MAYLRKTPLHLGVRGAVVSVVLEEVRAHAPALKHDQVGIITR